MRNRGWVLGFGMALGLMSCEAPPQEATGNLRVSLYHGEFLRYAQWAGWPDGEPRSYELEFSVADASGREVDREVVATTLYAWTTNLTLDCVPGEHHAVRVRLLGAYAGRPLAPRGGRGGLALPQPYQTTTDVLCSESRANKVYLPDVTAPAVPDAPVAPTQDHGAIGLDVAIALPAPLADQDVVVTWEETVTYPDFGPFTYSYLLLVPALDGEDERFSYACDPYAGATLRIRLRPLMVLVDGEPLPRDAWRLDDVVREARCPDSGEVLAARANLQLHVVAEDQP